MAEAPPASRSKALVWLRGRSTLIASATGTCKLAQKSRLDYLWGGKSAADLEREAEHADEDPGEPPPRPGVTFEWEPNSTADDKLPATITPTTPLEEIVAMVDQQILSQELLLRLLATYVPLKQRVKPPGMEFAFDGKVRSGVPEFVAAKAGSRQDQPVVVLVLTPWFDIIR